MRQLLLALQFLTVLPVYPVRSSTSSGIKITSGIKGKDFGKSLIYFPLIGLLIGVILSSAAYALNFLPNLVMSAVIVALWVGITGGIHLDGFADTCDGFYGQKSGEERLKIMRDSHIGVMGMAGIVCILLLKFTLIAGMPQNFLWKALIMASVFARWSQAFACRIADYARKDGKAKYFMKYAGKKEIFAGAIFTLALFLVLMGTKTGIILPLSLVCVFLFVAYCRKKIGGMTGDTIGATNEIAEVSVLLFCIFLAK